jgi:cephalosporin hydroxylase
MVQAQVNPTGHVVSIDIRDLVNEAKKRPIAQTHITFIRGSSVDPNVVQRIKAMADGKRVLVLLDSNHHRNHVLKELKAYAPMVSKGSYLIVQDTNINGNPVLPDFGPGPMEAVKEFLKNHPQFVADRNRERLMFTVCPEGYLKRIKGNPVKTH